MDLGGAALDVAPLLARLEVLPPAPVRHLLLQQEPTSPPHLGTRLPANGGATATSGGELEVHGTQVGFGARIKS